MSFYSEYAKERFGHETIESEYGFISYSIKPNMLFIEECYVPKYRRMDGVASEFVQMVESMAKECKKKYLGCSVSIDAINANDSLKAVLAYGFKLDSMDSGKNLIYFIKEVF